MLTLAEIEHRTVVETDRVGPRSKVELVDEQSAHPVALVTVEAEDVEEPVERGGTGPVGLVDVHPGLGEQPVARHVVFVGVAVEHGVDQAGRPTPGHHGDRGVDDDGLAGCRRPGESWPTDTAPGRRRSSRSTAGVEDPTRLTPVDRHVQGVAGGADERRWRYTTRRHRIATCRGRFGP